MPETDILSEGVVARMLHLSRAAGLATTLLGLSALVGWFVPLPVLTRLQPDWPPIKANTAVCCVLLGLALGLRGRALGAAAARALASTAALIAVASLAEDIWGVPLGIDELLVRDLEAAARPGRMAMHTAVVISLLGSGIAGLDGSVRIRAWSQWAGLLGVLAALLPLSGYLYGIEELYAATRFGTASALSAGSMLLTGVGLFLAQPRLGVARVLSADTAGGALARRLLPAILIAPIAIGWLGLQGQAAHLYGDRFRVALVAVSNIMILGTVTWMTCRRLIDSEASRLKAHRELAESRRRIRTTFRSIGDGVIAVDTQQAVTFMNAAAERLTGWSERETVGRHFREVYATDDPDITALADNPIVAALSPGIQDSSFRRTSLIARHGHTTPISECASPILSEDGEVEGAVVVFRDTSAAEAADNATRRSQHMLHLIIDTALDAVITADASGQITGWNRQAEHTFGWSRDEVVGRRLLSWLIADSSRSWFEQALRDFDSPGDSSLVNRRTELPALHRDGHELLVELSITPIRVGSTLSFSAFARDLTEPTRTRQALSESRQHYDSLAESLPHLVWTCRQDGQCDFLSRQWVDYTGHPAEEQLGYGWLERIHPEDRARVQEEWSAATLRGDHFDIEFRIQRHDGAYRWFKTRAVPLRDASGAIARWFGSNTDIDDYIRAERRLHRQVERLDLLARLTRAIAERQHLRSILQVVVTSLEEQMPLDFCCIALHDAARQSLVVTRVGFKSELLSQALAMKEGSELAIGENGLSRCVSGKLVHEYDLASIRLDFPQRLAQAGLRSMVAAPLMSDSKVFAVLIAARSDSPGFSSPDCEFLRQLSEHVALAAHQAELYDALLRAYDDLRQTQQAVMQQERLKALGQMASGIAHDINNALSPAAVYTEALLETESQLSHQGREQLAIVRSAIEDVAHTVARMGEFYRDNEPGWAPAVIPVNRLVEEVIRLTRARWQDMLQKGGAVVTIAMDLSPDAPLINGVESELREALINLVFNAVDAMPLGGTLTLRTRTSPQAEALGPGPTVEIEVSDTGVGMDADTQRRCLEPFFTTKGARGTGLGLAMVYGIVQRHQGHLEIESQVGRGTTIRMIAPLASGPASPARSDVRYAPSKRRRILLVDDDPLLLRSVRDVLEADGHSVTTCSGGQAGIDAFQAPHSDGPAFDLVITDLGMPHVDGRRVAQCIKQVSPATPVILLTGWGQRLVSDDDVPAHVDQVMSKPPKLAELRVAIATLT